MINSSNAQITNVFEMGERLPASAELFVSALVQLDDIRRHTRGRNAVRGEQRRARRRRKWRLITDRIGKRRRGWVIGEANTGNGSCLVTDVQVLKGRNF